jgi:hypothetical protein
MVETVTILERVLEKESADMLKQHAENRIKRIID